MLSLLLVAALAAPDALRMTDGWVRSAPPGAPTTAGYLTVENTGSSPDRLVGVSSPDAARAELHGMDMAGGVMRMRPLTGGAAVPAHGRLELQPAGGRHIMLIAPRRRFVDGDHVTAALTFERAGRRVVTLPVRTAPPPRAGSHGTHAK